MKRIGKFSFFLKKFGFLIVLILCQSCSQSNVPVSEQAKELCDEAYAKNQTGDYATALVDCNKAIELDPKCWPAYDDRGIAKSMLNEDFMGAMADFNTAIELNPNDPVLYSDRGFAKEKSHDDKGAIADFNKAIELNPKDARVYINRASAKYDLNDYDGAKADYKAALALDPQNDKVAKLVQEGIDSINAALSK